MFGRQWATADPEEALMLMEENRTRLDLLEMMLDTET